MLKKHAIILDFDSTIISTETLEELFAHAFFGKEDLETVLKQVAEITNAGMEGRITFQESLRKRLELLSLNESELEPVAEKLKSFVAEGFADFAAQHADSIYVVSGGFRELIIPVLKDFAIAEDHIYANTLEFQNGMLTGIDWANPLAASGGKAKVASKIGRHPVVMVGDGSTDLEVKQAGVAELFICYAEFVRREHVAAAADHQVASFSELTELVNNLNVESPQGLTVNINPLS